MIKQKKFISKKRKKKFKTVQSSNLKFQKNNPNNTSLFEMKQPFITQENEVNPTFNNSNLEKENEDSKRVSHITKELSKQVSDFIKDNKITSVKQIKEYIKNIYKQKKTNKSTLKRIPKKINDILTILNAIGEIKINNNIIEYNNYNTKPQSYNNEYNQLIKINEDNENFGDNEDERDEDDNNDGKNAQNDDNNDDCCKKEIKKKIKKLEELRKDLMKKFILLQFYKRYGDKIEEPEKNKNNNSQVPLDIIKSNSTFPIENNTSKDLSNCSLSSNSEFTNILTYNIIKKIVAPKILSKLNENNNTNISDNLDITKDNSLKMINEESFLDCRKNINIKGDKGKTFQEKRHINDNNNEIENSIFNYLKNVNILNDQMTFYFDDEDVNKKL
jgi:hypothetical protein